MTQSTTAAERERKRKRLELRIGAMVLVAIEDDGVDARDAIAILTAEVERLKRTLPS